MSAEVIIRKQKINITVGNEKLAFECRQAVNERASEELVKMYERIFYQSTLMDEYITINSIKIDLGVISVSDFQNRFYPLIEQELIIELQKQFEKSSDFASTANHFPDPASATRQTDSETIQFASVSVQESAALIYFLEKGIYPWWYKKSKFKAPDEILKGFNEIEQSNFLIKIYAAAKKLSTYQLAQLIKRLFIYLDDTTYEAFLISLVELQADDSIRNNLFLLLNQNTTLSQYFRIPQKAFYQKLFRFILLNMETANVIKSFISALNQQFPVTSESFKTPVTGLETLDEPIRSALENARLSVPEIPIKKKIINRSDKPVNEDGIYIGNAGLVLLHPFLPAYFQSLGLVDDAGQFISAEAKTRAAVLLYYLHEGSADYKEWEMPLNKILCGIEPTEVIESGIELSASELTESTLLLQTVVDYWAALKGASTQSLQETFLKRNGKISFKEDFWLIQVEKTGVDILLERLPWGIGTIKLPWLQPIIYTEW